MEKVEKFGLTCFRVPVASAPAEAYAYDQEPEEVAHYLKSSRMWQAVKRDKIALCSIKKGELVWSKGYLYGSRQAIETHQEQQTESKESPLLDVLLELFRSNVMDREQTLERMLRHTNLLTAERLLASM